MNHNCTSLSSKDIRFKVTGKLFLCTRYKFIAHLIDQVSFVYLGAFHAQVEPTGVLKIVINMTTSISPIFIYLFIQDFTKRNKSHVNHLPRNWKVMFMNRIRTSGLKHWVINSFIKFGAFRNAAKQIVLVH